MNLVLDSGKILYFQVDSSNVQRSVLYIAIFMFDWLCNSEGKMWEEKNGIEKLSKNFSDVPVPLEMSIVKF